jgi:hypothetical protein
MESSLHRELKNLYAGDAAQCEVRLGTYRIDAVREDGCLIEIQHGSLAAIRRKLEHLLRTNQRVLLVKPIIHRKRIVWLKRRGGTETARRWSPKRCSFIDLFLELVYVARVFPHPRLTLEVPLVEIEERRVRVRTKRRRLFAHDYTIAEQTLTRIVESRRFCHNEDLMQLLPSNLPQPFHTAHLAESLSITRWLAQRIAYCLRTMGAVSECGKHGNARLYTRKELQNANGKMQIAK